MVAGNETFERLATFGVLANFMVYLRREYHMDQVDAVNLINVFSGVSNFAPLLGAFLSDAFTGRFWAIAVGSLASFLVCYVNPTILYYIILPPFLNTCMSKKIKQDTLVK